MSKEAVIPPTPAGRLPARLRLAWPGLRRAYGKPFAGLLLAAAAALVLGIFAGAEHESLAITEGRFLAIEIGLVLASIGWLGRSLLPPLAAGASVFAALALPALPTRAATIGLLLVLGWLLAAAPLARRQSVTPLDWFFAALGLQALARPELLLSPWGPRTAAVVLLPLLAAGALTLLAGRYGNERAFFALAVLALLAPGLNVNATLVLLAAAAGVAAGDEKFPLPWRGLAAAFLLLPLLLRWPTGLLAAAAGACLLIERIAPRRLAIPAFLAALVASLSVGRPHGEPLAAFLLVAALLPAAFAALDEVRQRVAAAAFLLFGAAWLTPDLEALAAGALLLALSLPVERPALAAQPFYLLVILGAGLGLASYPWLRPEPLHELLTLLAPSAAYAFGGALLLVLGPGLLAERWAERSGSPLAKAGRPLIALCLAGLCVVTLFRVPPAGVLLLAGTPQALVEARPRLRLAIKAPPFREVIVDSQLFHGADLAPGQEVAALQLYAADGRLLLALPLRAGDDTADWTAARGDQERRPDFRAPPPWLSQVAPDGTFFSSRFRRRFLLPASLDAAAIELVRAAGLPAATQIAFHELELRP